MVGVTDGIPVARLIVVEHVVEPDNKSNGW